MAMGGFGEIAERLRRSTVLIHSGGRGGGSGVIWTSEGLLVTNSHVARGPHAHVELWDGRSFKATLTARDPRRDLAALQISASGLPAEPRADSSQVRPGELVIAIGNPLGFVGALSIGVIHGIGVIRGLGTQSWVQAAVRLARGNSGGPLADARGRVIAINTMVAGRLALAVPSNAVERFLAAGAEDAWLGVTLHPIHLPRRGDHSFGLLVLEIAPGSPAERASILPGDILLGTEEQSFGSVEDLARVLEGGQARLVRFRFLRGDYVHERRVTLQLGGRTAAAA